MHHNIPVVPISWGKVCQVSNPPFAVRRNLSLDWGPPHRITIRPLQVSLQSSSSKGGGDDEFLKGVYLVAGEDRRRCHSFNGIYWPRRFCSIAVQIKRGCLSRSIGYNPPLSWKELAWRLSTFRSGTIYSFPLRDLVLLFAQSYSCSRCCYLFFQPPQKGMRSFRDRLYHHNDRYPSNKGLPR